MIQELVSRAEKQGYITLNDILELTDEENKEEYPSLESILYELDELGIEIRNVLTDDDDDSAVDSPLSDDDFNSEDPYHQMHDLMQVSSEAGAMASSISGVSIYAEWTSDVA